jgi:biotin-(acetyl-CoA carboxylase) ligase
MKASTGDPQEQPDWLVVGLDLAMESPQDNPGTDPDRTYLSEEGCADITPDQLLEAWVRHSLYWINRWLDEGPRPVHDTWRALARDLGEPVEIDGNKGTFVGVDENFGMLLRTGEDTILVPLSSRLD